jgi:hypothetical protein
LQLSARPWLYQLSQKYGKTITLANLPDSELDALVAKGFDAVYLLGVWKLGPYGLEHDRTDPNLLYWYGQELPDFTLDDVIGSPFAVTNYTTNPDIGDDYQLTVFRQRLHSKGMKLILDFVPNHSAVDCERTSTHPEYYVRAPPTDTPPYDATRYLPNGIAYGRDKYGSIWTDTAQFNYWEPATIAIRIQDLLTVASFADGIRCDMAMLLINDIISDVWSYELGAWGYSRPAAEFWVTAIAEVKAAFPETFFLAEVYWGLASTLLAQGFDYAYDKEGLYDALRGGNLDAIRSRIDWEISSGELWHSAHFVGNHDEGSAAAQFGSPYRADAAAMVTFLLPGMRFHWMGDDEGDSSRLDIHLRRRYADPNLPGYVSDFYSAIYPIISNPAVREGQFTFLEGIPGDSAWRLLGWKYDYFAVNGEQRYILVVVNYSDATGEGHFKLPEALNVADAQGNVTLTDLVTGETYVRNAQTMASTGLEVIVGQYWYQVFQF